MNRRQLLGTALWSSGGLGLRALATGLPPSFLLTRTVPAQAEDQQPTYLIMSSAQAGHPFNGNGPGTYARNPNDGMDPITQVGHPTVRELGTDVLGTIDGQPFSAADFENPIDLRLGEHTAKASAAWGAVSPSLLSRSTFIHHATYANAHPEFAQVMQFHGAIVGRDGSGPEMLPSMIAQESASALGTLLDQPINVGGGAITFEGRPLGQLDPRELQTLFGGARHPTGVPNAADIVRLRDSVLDELYRDLRSVGTPAQRAFLDEYALGRQRALELGDQLGPLLSEVSSNNPIDEVRAAVALLQLNITPVVVLQLPFGGDNHQDGALAREVEETLESIEVLNFLWAELERAGLQDRVTFANLDVFGRTLVRNGRGGRDHNKNHHLMMLSGPRVRAGVVGGLEPVTRGNGSLRDFSATAIGDLPVDQTLEAAGKTVAAAVGLSQDRIEARIRGGRTLDQALI